MKKFAVVLFLLVAAPAWAADRVEKKDTNGDGRIDTWTTTDKAGVPLEIRSDRSHKDGKVDRWVYFKNGKMVRTEWDRNFDGKPDFKVFQDGTRLIEKQYDDNFDGKYERTVKAPEKGTVDSTSTTPPARPKGLQS